MEWYLSEKNDDFIIPDDRELTEDVASSQDDWCQWGVTGSNDIRPLNKYCDTTFLRNSFLEEETFPDSVYESIPVEGLRSNIVVDPEVLMESSQSGSSTCMNDFSFQFFMDAMLQDWDKAEGSSPSCLLLDESKRPEGSPMEAVVCATNKTEDVNDGDECFEATVLLELEDVMIQLSEKTRICFRDALYRLSESSQQQHMIYQDRSACLPDWPAFAQVTGESSRMGRARCVESSTNAIDKTIEKFIFSNRGPPNLPFL